MRKILMFLATDGAFLYENHHCSIVASEYVSTFGGTGSVTLCNDVVELKFWLDRDRLCMQLRASDSKSAKSWFSIDILRQLVTDQIIGTSEMDEENLDFLRAKFSDLQALFDSSNVSATEAACRKLKQQRTKRMFG
jgi:hypothetical protein